VAEYDALYGELMAELPQRQRKISDPDEDPTEVARQIVRIVDLPKGHRPFRVYIDPMHNGAEEVFELGDRIRTEFYTRSGLGALLSPAPRSQLPRRAGVRYARPGFS
jgi:hypothetical protein